MTVGVVIGTYGDYDVWQPFVSRALRSVSAQTTPPESVVHVHGDTLAQARNEGARQADTDHLVFLDADDQLHSAYVETMKTGVSQLRQPATLGYYPDGRTDALPVVIPSRPSIRQGNWFVVGTMIDSSLFWNAGGFQEEPAWEDWSLMLRCFALGADWESMSNAVYWVYVNPNSRNNQVAGDGTLFRSILSANDQWAAQRGLVIR